MPIWVYAGHVAGPWAMVAIAEEMGQGVVGRVAGRDNWLKASRQTDFGSCRAERQPDLRDLRVRAAPILIGLRYAGFGQGDVWAAWI